MKTLSSTVLRILLIIAAVFSFSKANAHDFEVDGIYYNFDYEYENGVMVTYRGSSGYDYSNRYVGNVVIPTTVNYNGTTYSVKSIGRDAFYNCSRLTNVTIPNSVMSIGGRAFYGCRGLINITIPNSVTTIDYLAFSGCTGLKGVYITDLAAWCNISFDYSDSNPLSCAHRLYVNGYEVIELNIPNNVTAIGNYAFYGCSGLASINIPNSITTIGDHAFYGCTALTSVSIPSSVTTIGYAAFSNCSMDILNFNAVDCASFDQSNLNIFYDSNILTINFGDSVHKIPDCFGLGIKGVTNVSIGNSVIDIGKLAFYRFSQLKTIIIPNSVKSIGNSAFCDCSGMTSISIPNSVTSIGGWAFGNCTGLTSINIPNTITSIEEYTFKGCSGLTSINIPSSVTAIGNYAFKDCSRLSNIDIPNSVTSIGYDAFSSTAWYNSQPDGLIYAGLIAYSYKGTMPSGTNIILRDGTLGISGYAFKDCQGLISIDIPNSITNIGKSAFYGCSGLTSIDIPNLVTTIDSYAFSGCNGLTSIDIPNSVTNIGNSAFYGCSGLTSVNIPNSVTIIGSSAFESCSSLTDVHSSIADPSVISMGDNVFFLNNEDYSNRKLHVPLGSIPAYLVDQKWRIYFATVEDGDTVVTLKLKGELLIAEGGNEVHCNDTSISYDQLWISYTGDEDVEFTILYDDYFDVMPGGGGGQKRDGERNSYYLLNGDYVSEYVSWDDQNKRYIVDLYSLVYDDVFDDFDSEYLNYYNIYCCFSFIITVHADGYNDLSKEYSGHSSHYPEVEGGDSPPEISDPICSNLTAFINVYYEWSVNGSYVSSPYNYEQLDFGDDEFEHPDVYAFERRDEDYYVTVSAYQHSAPSGMYWGDSSRTLLIPARECSISISRFLDNEPLSTFYFCDGEEYGMIISPDFDVIGEKESLAVAEFSQWLQPFGYIYDYDYNWNFDCQISIDGQTVSNYFSDYSDILDISYCVVDLLPYGNAFGGNHQIKVTATDGYNSLSVDTVLSYHPIDTILTPYSLVIDVNSGKGGCLLIVDDEEVELSNDGPGTPAHIYALPRKDHDYSITVQVGNFIATSDYGEKVDELYVCYQGRCQETTIVVPAKEFFDFEEDGVYYSITSENKVIVTRSEEAYQGVVIVPSTVTYDGVTYTVTGIGYDAFADADLTNLVLPVTISSIDSTAFTNCHIHSLVITGDGTWTGGAISCDVDNLYVMGTVTGIKGLQVNPTTVYSYPTVPPTCDEQSFTGYDGELHVPASALAAYFTAPYWCNFINIVGDAIEPTGLTVNRDSVEVLVGNQLRLTATAVPANATPNEIFWTSND